MSSEEHEVMANALEAEARLQEQGFIRRIGETYDQTMAVFSRSTLTSTSQ
jgi:hypothetical protein